MYWRMMWKLVLYCSFLYCLVCEEHDVTITRVEDGDVITADDDVFKLDCSQIQGSEEHQQTSCKCEKNRSIFHQYPNQTYGCYQSQTFCKGCSYIGNVTYIKDKRLLIVIGNIGMALTKVLNCLFNPSSKKKISQWKETAWNELTNKTTISTAPGSFKISSSELLTNRSVQGSLIWFELKECTSKPNKFNYLFKVNGYETVNINISIIRHPSTATETSTVQSTKPLSTSSSPPPTTTTTPSTSTLQTTTKSTSTLSTTNKENKTTGIVKDEKDDGNIVEIIVPIVVVVFMVVAVIIFICCRKSKNDNYIKTMNTKVPTAYDNKSMDVEGQTYDDIAVKSSKAKDSNTSPCSIEPLYCETTPHYQQTSIELEPMTNNNDSKASLPAEPSVSNPVYDTYEPTTGKDVNQPEMNDDMNTPPFAMPNNHSHPREEQQYFELEGTYDSAGAILDTDEIMEDNSAGEGIIEDEYAVVDKSSKTKYVP